MAFKPLPLYVTAGPRSRQPAGPSGGTRHRWCGPPRWWCASAATTERAERRAKAIGREVGELRENGAAGTPDEAAATLRRGRAPRPIRTYLQVLDLHDLEHLQLIAEEVAPHLS